MTASRVNKTIPHNTLEQIIQVPAGESHYLIKYAVGSQAEKSPQASYLFVMNHPQSRLLVSIQTEAAGESYPLLKVQVQVKAPRCKAEVRGRSLVKARAFSRFEGKIRIEKDAELSQALLEHQSLLLGPSSHSASLPALEVLNRSSKSRHNSAIRYLEKSDLFYLLSRGLSLSQARDILTKAFLAEIVLPEPQPILLCP